MRAAAIAESKGWAKALRRVTRGTQASIDPGKPADAGSGVLAAAVAGVDIRAGIVHRGELPPQSASTLNERKRSAVTFLPRQP